MQLKRKRVDAVKRKRVDAVKRWVFFVVVFRPWPRHDRTTTQHRRHRMSFQSTGCGKNTGSGKSVEKCFPLYAEGGPFRCVGRDGETS